MPLITIKETAGFDQSPNAIVIFDRHEFPITVKDPFSAEEEERLEWYFETYLEFPFANQVEYKQAAESVKAYGQSLFAQIFESNVKVFGRYTQARQADLSSLNFEIIGSPEFHRLHWEAIREPEFEPFVIHAPMVRTTVHPPKITINVQPSPTINLLIVTARPGVASDVGYRTISRPLVNGLRKANLPVRIDILRPGTYSALMNHLNKIRTDKGVGYYHIVHFDLHGALMTHEQTKTFCKADCVMFKRYGRPEISEYEGKKAFLFFEPEDDSKADYAEASEIAELLIYHHVPVVILNACQSGKQIGTTETSLGSRLLQSGVQNVLAMGYSVTVSAAELMMKTLYQSLFEKNDISLAVRKARAELYADKERRAYFNQKIDLEDWLLPVAYTGSSGGHTALPLRRMSSEEEAAYLFSESSSYTAPEPTYGFIGRDLDILQIEKRLLSVSEDKTRNLLLIRGMGGAGKTSLLHHLMEWWQKTGFVKEVFYFGYDAKAYTLHQIMDNIAEKLFSKGPLPRGFAVSPELSAFRSMSLQMQQQKLSNILIKERHLLVLDNLESVTGEYLSIRNTLTIEERQAIRAFLAGLLNGETLVLMGTRGGEDWLISGKNAPLRKNDIYDLPGLDPESASKLAENVLNRHVQDRKKRSEYQKSKEFQRLLKILNGYPLPIEVVLENLSRQTPAQIADALQAGDVNLDAEDAQEKTDSILKCIDYSHSALSEDAQKMLLCLAPFTGVINVQWLTQYYPTPDPSPKRRGESDQFPIPSQGRGQGVRSWQDIIRECVSRGLMGAHEFPGYINLQPIFPYFLRSRLNAADESLKKAIETGFRELYDGIGGALGQLLQSKEPQEKILGQALTRLEYENLMTALKLALEEQVSVWGCYVVLNTYYEANQDYPKALSVAQNVLSGLKNYPPEKISEDIRTERIRVTSDLADSYQKLKQYEQAEKAYLDKLNYLKEIEAIEKDRRWKSEAVTYHNLGIVAQEQRQYEQAEQYYQNALRIKIEFDDRYSQASTYHQLGIVAQEQRQYEQAEQYYQNALRIKIEFDDRYSQASTYHQLGRVAQEQRQYEQAEQYYQNALRIKIEFDDRYSQASTYHQLGRVAQEQRQYEQAEQYYQNALKIYIEFDDRYEQAGTYHQLGRVAQEQRQYEQAEQYYQNALKIYIEFDDRYEQAGTYHQLGWVAQEQRQYEQAREYYLKALGILNEYDEYSSGVALRNLSRLYSESQDAGLPAAVAGVLGISVEEAERVLAGALNED